jgi:hypothetical protein
VLYVVDLSRYVTADTWQPTEEQSVTVRVLTEEEARHRAQSSSDPDELGEDEIVRRWLETALVTVDPGSRMSEDRNDTALTAVRLPASLIRDVG